MLLFHNQFSDLAFGLIYDLFSLIYLVWQLLNLRGKLHDPFFSFPQFLCQQLSFLRWFGKKLFCSFFFFTNHKLIFWLLYSDFCLSFYRVILLTESYFSSYVIFWRYEATIKFLFLMASTCIEDRFISGNMSRFCCFPDAIS